MIPFPNKKYLLISVALLFFQVNISAQQADVDEQTETYWQLSGNNAISWDLTSETKLPHTDNIEMDGQKVAVIVTYEVDEERNLKVSRDVIFPQLRIFIESSANRWRKYRAYLRDEYSDELLPTITVDERTYEPGPLDSVQINGMLRFFHAQSQGLTVERSLLPSMTARLFVEVWKITNATDKPIEIELGKSEFIQEQAGQNGYFTRRVYADYEGEVVIDPGSSFSFGISFSAQLNEEKPIEQTYVDVLAERQDFLSVMNQNLMLETPDPRLNTLFYFSKIRASESIYDTKMGIMHSPGGGRYYTGVWANDQCEYASPFFPYLGYGIGNQSAFNSYMHFLKNIPEGDGNFWSSFEMEGTLTCCGGDRGDAAMIAYGASQYALASGNKGEAEKIWPLIEWSLDYCDRQKNEYGVINSDSDEMEGRIATGGANLATSSLYYGALQQSIFLAKALNKKASLIRQYEKQAKALKKSIEDYFGATIEGLETYQYFEGHPYLRHWICLPLVVGIDDRKKGTLDALFTKLWTDNGIKVEHNPDLEEPNLFWDRGTLYAFRGAFKAGAANRALEKLQSYSQTRLLGFHVPYVVEAWPEGNMAHLSAESALYCRIFTEGMLGIVPTGFKAFTMQPNIPDAWDYIKLKNVRAFDASFDIFIERDDDYLDVKILQAGKKIVETKVKAGDTIRVQLND